MTCNQFSVTVFQTFSKLYVCQINS